MSREFLKSAMPATGVAIASMLIYFHCQTVDPVIHSLQLFEH
ncbi:hypothetical protein [Nostoc sp. NMS7]|nr:hypothetical protein [Nostoc sp. NMS7]